MTEIEDLSSQPERQPAEPPLTGGQVALFLKAHNAGKPCECGGEWRLHDEARDECATSIGLFKLEDPERQSFKPTVALICKNCGLLRQFVRSVVTRWVEENRRG